MNQAENNVVRLHPVVLRLNPVTNSPVVFIADKPPVDDRVELVLEDNKHVTVDYEYYKHTQPLADDVAREVAAKYAKQAGVPIDALQLRTRLPKRMAPKGARQTNDADLNVGNGKPHQRRASDKQESSQDYRSQQERDESKSDELAQAAQALHDNHSKDVVQEPQQSEADNQQEAGKASASNPEGATVTPIKAKRSYKKRDPEQKQAKAVRSKRSQAALRRYQQEVAQTSEKMGVNIEAATSNVPEEKRREAVVQLAAEIAAILLKHPGVL